MHRAVAIWAVGVSLLFILPEFAAAYGLRHYADSTSTGDCHSKVSCSECLPSDDCIWCASSNTCNTTAEKDACRCVDPSCNECKNLTTCDQCTQNPYCGWCGSTQECYRGNVTDGCTPMFPVCPEPFWSFGNCSKNCQFLNGSCALCIEEHTVGCTYCEDSESCEPNDSAGSCLCPYTESCPAISCSAHVDCHTCKSDPSCGWCVNGGPEGEGACFSAYVIGGETSPSPCNPNLCPNPEMNWLFQSCAVNCTLFGDNGCQSCLSNTMSSCEWCPEMGMCLDSQDPYIFCTCPDELSCSNCSNAGSCSDCIASPECGWCGRTNQCMRGSNTGPCGGNCEALWSFGSCQDECSMYQNCGDCISKGNYDQCFWCASTEQCVGEQTHHNCTCPYSACPAEWCDTYTSCESCASNPSCGWCPLSNMCTEGTTSGPCNDVAGNCTGWSFGPSSDACDPVCELNTECNSCLDNPICGWCAGTQSGGKNSHSTSLCVLKGTTGPLDGRHCIDWRTESCANCNAASNCLGCVEDANCGWCAGSSGVNECVEGDKNMPFNPPAGCTEWSFGTCEPFCDDIISCGDCTATPGCGWCHSKDFPLGYCVGTSFSSGCWEFLEESCTPTCADYSSCTGCTSNSSCGWCNSGTGQKGPTTPVCLEGTGSGPGEWPCNEWYYGPASCSVSPVNCASIEDCADCTANPACGWCDINGGGCEPGTAVGPTAPAVCKSENWQFGGNDCAPPLTQCSSSLNCEDCVSSSQCGWCDASSTCMRGDKTGAAPPLNCNSWEFVQCANPLISSPPPPPPSGLSSWSVVGITSAVILVPVIGVAAFIYHRFLAKYGYSPLAGT